MEYQYKVIVSNRTVYKEFEIQPDMDRVKLGTGSSCEFRLNPEAFFTGIEMEFRKNGKSWNLECSDDVYFSRGDMRKLLSTEVRHGNVLSVCYASTGNEAFELRFLIDFEARVPDYNYYLEITGMIDIATDATADIILNSKFSSDSKIRLTLNGTQCQLEEIVSEYGMFKNIVIDIAVRHYYGDVRLYMLVDDEKRYQWARFLPHLMNAGGIRNIVFDNESKNNIFESLFRELTYREQTEEIPYYGIILVENEFGIKNHPISRYIERASELGMTFVFFENSAEELPLHCDEIIELHSESEGVICRAEDGNQIKQFEYHTITDRQAADLSLIHI